MLSQTQIFTSLKKTDTLKARRFNHKSKETHQYIVSPEETTFLQSQSGTVFSKISICSSAAPIGRTRLVSQNVYYQENMYIIINRIRTY